MKIKPLNDLSLIEYIVSVKNPLDAFLVGGCVRDWYTGKKCYDIDITFSDYPLKIAEKISQKFSMEYEEFPSFMTVRLKSQSRRVDLATFRKEKYPKPASLPVVTKAKTIEEDLSRRDFTVNAIAVSANENDIFKVYDPYQGLKDIDKGIIRILHSESFKDDPTRIFRAIRFSVRFNWKIEEKTMKLLIESLDFVKLLSAQRIKNEIIKILSEEKCYKILKKIIELNVLKKDELFDFDSEIDNLKTLDERFKYIAQKNGREFFEKYEFERKIKRNLNL